MRVVVDHGVAWIENAKHWCLLVLTRRFCRNLEHPKPAYKQGLFLTVLGAIETSKALLIVALSLCIDNGRMSTRQFGFLLDITPNLSQAMTNYTGMLHVGLARCVMVDGTLCLALRISSFCIVTRYWRS